MQPELERLGVTTDNAIYEGYSPLLPGLPRKIFDELKDVGGRLVPVDPAKKFVVESSCMQERYLDDPTYRAFYDKLEQQAPLVARARTDVEDWTRRSFEPLNLLLAPGAVWNSIRGGRIGCDIDVRRLQ
jgi:hypothetical protein